MRIQRIRVENCGPVAGFVWSPANVEVLFDSNEAGKTAIVDAVVSALLPDHAYRNLDRFGAKPRAHVTVRRATAEVTFPSKGKPRTLDAWLNWKNAQLGRLFCVRSGELELAADTAVHGTLVDALAEQLGEVAGGFAGVRAKIEKDACLTPTGKWREDVLEKVRKLTSGRKELEAARDTARRLGEAQQEHAGVKRDLEALGEARQHVNERIAEAKHAANVRKYHAARSREDDRASTRQDIQQNYVRYRSEDLEKWQALEAEQRALDDATKALSGLQRLNEAVAEAEEHLASATRELEAANKSAEAARVSLRASAGDLNALLEQLTAAGRRRDERATTTPLFLAGLVASVVVAAGFAIAALIRSMPGLWLGALICVAAAGWCLNALLDRSRDGRAVAGAEKALRDALAQHGISVADGDAYPAVLARWQQEREEATRQPEEEAEQKERDRRSAFDKLSGEANAARAAAEKILASGHNEYDWPWEPNGADPLAAQPRLEARGEDIDRESTRIRKESGCGKQGDLEGKLREKDELEEKWRRAGSELCGLLGVATPTAWPDEETERSVAAAVKALAADLAPAELLPSALDGIESAADIGEKLRTLESEGDDLDAQRNALEQQIAVLDTAIRTAQWELPHGINGSADLYRELDEVTMQVRERILGRLAGAWARREVEAMRLDHRTQLDSAVQDPDSGAEAALYAVTGRYDRIRFVDNTFHVTEAEADGAHAGGGRLEGEPATFTEAQLSDGARKQLLMVLRVTFLRHLLGDEPGFLVLDDAFITFDDDGRKARAVAWLGDLVAGGWQVLYLTTDSTTRDLFCARFPTLKPLRVADCCETPTDAIIGSEALVSGDVAFSAPAAASDRDGTQRPV